MRAFKLTLLALVVSVAPAWAQAQQGVPRWPGITMPTFVIPASAVSGSGGVSSSLIPTVDNSFDLGSSSFRWRSIYWGTQALGPDGSAAAPSYSFASQANKGVYSDGSNTIAIALNGSREHKFGIGYLSILNNSASIFFGTSEDASISRGAAGRVDTTKAFRMTPVAFASLPTAAEGAIAAVNNSSTNTWGATCDGAGALHVLCYYNGTNWTVFGK